MISAAWDSLVEAELQILKLKRLILLDQGVN